MEAKQDPKMTILALTEKLLNSIATANWETYAEFCDESLTCFEPEANGHLVEGLEFHHFYFQLGAPKGSVNTTISSPNIRLIGETVAIISYIRLT